MKKILIIEDNIYLQSILTSLIEESGYSSVIAGDKKNGLNKFKENDPDLILLDKKLPDGDGFEILKKVKEVNSLLPVIILTSHSEQKIKDKAFSLGANAFINKPFDNSELLSVIKEFLV